MPRRDLGAVPAEGGTGQAQSDKAHLSRARPNSPMMEGIVAKSQELSVQQKKELSSKEEKTVPAKYYVPNANIHETEEALTVVMEIPGVEKKDVSVKLENGVLSIEGRVDFSNYEGL